MPRGGPGLARWRLEPVAGPRPDLRRWMNAGGSLNLLLNRWWTLPQHFDQMTSWYYRERLRQATHHAYRQGLRGLGYA